MKYFKITTAFIFFSFSVWANQDLTNFDNLYYDPLKLGLRDLLFKAEVVNLKDQLNKQKNFGKIKEVFYEIAWMAPGKYEVQVFGLPDGFKQLKEQLKLLIVPRLDFVIPQKLSNKMRPYQFKKVNTKNGFRLEGVDKTHSNNISKINLYFNNNGLITRIKTFSPRGTQTSKLSYEKDSKSNKYIMNKILAETILGQQKNVINTTISYESFDGFKLPTKVSVETTTSFLIEDGSDKKMTRESVINFSNYQVNTGKGKIK